MAHSSTIYYCHRIVATAPLASLQPATRAHFRTHGSTVLDTLTSGALQGAASVSASTSVGAKAALLLQQSSSAQAALEISGWIMADIIGQQTSDASHVSYAGIDLLMEISFGFRF